MGRRMHGSARCRRRSWPTLDRSRRTRRSLRRAAPPQALVTSHQAGKSSAGRWTAAVRVVDDERAPSAVARRGRRGSGPQNRPEATAEVRLGARTDTGKRMTKKHGEIVLGRHGPTALGEERSRHTLCVRLAVHEDSVVVEDHRFEGRWAAHAAIVHAHPALVIL